jgi:hypothetical protein
MEKDACICTQNYFRPNSLPYIAFTAQELAPTQVISENFHQ